jgi:hypothetical protein
MAGGLLAADRKYFFEIGGYGKNLQLNLFIYLFFIV